MAGTEYLILGQNPDGTWVSAAAPVTAASANAAIRATVGQDGTYVALPSRSWKPLVVTFENKPTVKAQS